ncbi:MAG: hypothetical protein ACLUHE_14420 [Christensenellales bacterium]
MTDTRPNPWAISSWPSAPARIFIRSKRRFSPWRLPAARRFCARRIRRPAPSLPALCGFPPGLLSREQHVLIANSEGLYTGDTRVYTRLLCSAVSQRRERKPDRHAQPRRADGL